MSERQLPDIELTSSVDLCAVLQVTRSQRDEARALLHKLAFLLLGSLCLNVLCIIAVIAETW